MASADTKTALIIGAGIIGLSTAYQLHKRGFTVTIVSAEPSTETTACGSAGAIATAAILPESSPGHILQVPRWLLDPLGPLSIRFSYMPRFAGWLWKFLRAANKRTATTTAEALAAIMSHARTDHFALMADIGATHLINEKGGLWVYHSEKSRQKEAHSWALRKQLGIKFETLDRQQILEREPDLGPLAHCGYFVPDWCHYSDPCEIVSALEEHLRKSGVEFVPDKVTGFEFANGKPDAALTTAGKNIPFDTCVIAAGARSTQLSRQLGDAFPLESERGYNTTLADTGLSFNSFITFEEQFVLTPMSIGLRIGGAVEFAGLEAAPNYARSDALLTLAKRYVPELQDAKGTQWMGHRPSTPDSRPVISASTQFSNIFYGFGHGHIGLTLGPTTGKLLADIITGQTPPVALAPFSIGRYS